MIHVIDTSSLIVLQHYFPKQFPTFWKNFDSAVEAGEVLSVREVLKEFSPDREWLAKWIDQHKEMFVTPGPNETAFVAKIFQVPNFQNLVTERQRLRGQPVADPFVIACASVAKRLRCDRGKAEGKFRKDTNCLRTFRDCLHKHGRFSRCTGLDILRRRLTLSWSGLRPAALVGYLARASSGPKPLSSERWTDQTRER